MALQEEFLRRREAEIARRFEVGDEHAHRARSLARRLEAMMGTTRDELRRRRLGDRERAVPARRVLPGLLFAAGVPGLPRDATIELLDALPQAIAIVNRRADVLFGNAAWYEDVAEPGTELAASPPYFATLPRGGEAVAADPFEAAIRDVLRGARSSVRGELRLQIHGRSRHFLVDATGMPSGGAVVTHVDATDLIERRDEVERQAERDGLTDLLNHQAFHAHARRALARASDDGSRLHVLMVDLDDFKAVNDRFGHHVGDYVLVTTSRTQARSRRDVAARLGGDEFGVLVRGPDDPHELATRVEESLSAPIAVEGRLTRPGASVGMASFPADGDGIDALLRRADERMYRTKRERRRASPDDREPPR